MATKLRKSKFEYKRQISIAQQMVDFIKANKIIPDSNNRVISVISFDWNVSNYAKSYEV
jgi:hypothetical protein